MTSLVQSVVDLCAGARVASRRLATTDNATRSGALKKAAERLLAESKNIQSENRLDVEAARAAGLSSPIIDRLRLDGERIAAMAKGMETVATLPDPLAEALSEWNTPAGLRISQVAIPIGVIAVIYESRPNVTADVAALCVKSGNATVLKGGKEAIRSNSVIADLIQSEFHAAGLPANALQLIRSTEREATRILLGQEENVDVIIPRGGPGLVRTIAENSRIPVIKHYEGICHTYVDEDADLEVADEIAFNAKVQRPGVCNAMETLLVHEKIAGSFLSTVGPRLLDAGVELRGCERCRRILPAAAVATEDDWSREYLDLILSIKVVASLDEAIEFINAYGSGHSDCIVTRSRPRADRFLAEVDSAVVYENASTRFTDGFEFGFGAEVGISTNRLHARGPMGLRELTTYKYVVRGDGHIR